MPITPHTPVEALAEIVRDIEAAHGVGAASLAQEWPDLHASYEAAKATLEQPSVVAGTHPSASATASIIRESVQKIIDECYDTVAAPAALGGNPPPIMAAIIDAESDDEVVALGRALLLWHDGPGTEPDYKTTGRRCHSHILAIAGALHSLDTPAVAPAPEEKIILREYQVTIWYEDQTTYQATQTIVASNYKVAAEHMKAEAEAGRFTFENVGSTQSSYGFEVKTPLGQTFAWEED